ncbi:MAG: hypothetical protein AVDCRST_MAG71-1490 [uncultured Lysobacter sp.]|uniref:Uncharacterized protein n=1 Tax=uncultured Lysobacter sp. TaxID=271060 RepID=A0A6J4L7G0_9GAMM|nr:MAG: hypothetical protein AVDCRST_MAG71-1490 [uncultured Lysobacter sp.]
MGTRKDPNGDTRSGVGQQGDDVRASGTEGGTRAPDNTLRAQQALEGTEDDDLGAGTEEEMLLRASRATPPMRDVRSDVSSAATGEPL